MISVLKQVWNDCERPIDYFFALWIYGLFGMFVFGFITLLYGIFSGQADIENATFGIFDTLGS